MDPLRNGLQFCYGENWAYRYFLDFNIQQILIGDIYLGFGILIVVSIFGCVISGSDARFSLLSQFHLIQTISDIPLSY